MAINRRIAKRKSKQKAEKLFATTMAERYTPERTLGVFWGSAH